MVGPWLGSRCRHRGEVGHRLGERILVRLGHQKVPDLLAAELLLEQGGENDGADPGVGERSHPVDAAGHRRGRGDQRTAQGQSEVLGLQIDHGHHEPFLASLARSAAKPSAGRVAISSYTVHR